MMTQEEAAKYFIVAWVKDWSLPLYLATVAGPEGKDWSGRYEDAHKLFPWLPDNPFLFIKRATVRRYLADCFPLLNNKLWDIADNRARLALASTVKALSGKGAKIGKNRMREEVLRESKQSAKAFQANRIGYHASVEEMRRGNGHAWNVCK